MASPTYLSAQVIVAALQSDDWGTALEEIGKYVGEDQRLVADKSIALGADPDTIATLLGSLTGETIEVEGKAPVLRPKSGLAWQPFAIAASTLAGFLAGRWWKRRRKRKVA